MVSKDGYSKNDKGVPLFRFKIQNTLEHVHDCMIGWEALLNHIAEACHQIVRKHHDSDS